MQGRAFGLNRAMDSFGSFVSLILAFILILLLQGNALKMQPDTFRWLAGLSAIPGIDACPERPCPRPDPPPEGSP